MKKYLIWACAALTAMVCMTACDETTYVSYPDSDFPEYLTVSSLPDSCKMEVVKVRYDYYACIENAWVEITDSATIKEFQEGMDKAEIKEKLKEIESQIKSSSSSKKISSSSSAKDTDEEVESSDSEEEEYNEEDDVCTGRHCDDGKSGGSKKKNNNSDDSSSSSSDEGGEGGEGGEESSSSSDEGGEGGEGGEESSSSSDEGGEGGEEESSSSGSEPEVDCSEQVFDPDDYFCDDRDGHVYKKMTVDDQIWMAENLAYKTPNAKYFGEEVREGEGYLQDNHPEWGYYYFYDEATTLACPTGWHLPSNTEWQNAVDNYPSVVNAISALEILASGYYESSWYDDGYPSFWSSGPATSPYFSVYDGFFNSTYSPSDELAMNSIRCVQD